MNNSIISVILEKRTEDAPDVQEILTRHGCNIKVRLGIHDIEGCSNNGLILLITKGEEDEINDLVTDLKNFPRSKVQVMNLM